MTSFLNNRADLAGDALAVMMVVVLVMVLLGESGRRQRQQQHRRQRQDQTFLHYYSLSSRQAGHFHFYSRAFGPAISSSAEESST